MRRIHLWTRVVYVVSGLLITIPVFAKGNYGVEKHCPSDYQGDSAIRSHSEACEYAAVVYDQWPNS